MDDRQIIQLYSERSEAAISETANKYGKYCYYIAYHILLSNEDSEECVSDTYMRAWNVIPPQCQEKLATFLGKITRNLALNRYRYHTRQKRGYGQVTLILDELQECIADNNNIEQEIEERFLVKIVLSVWIMKHSKVLFLMVFQKKNNRKHIMHLLMI